MIPTVTGENGQRKVHERVQDRRPRKRCRTRTQAVMAPRVAQTTTVSTAMTAVRRRRAARRMRERLGQRGPTGLNAVQKIAPSGNRIRTPT